MHHYHATLVKVFLVYLIGLSVKLSFLHILFRATLYVIKLIFVLVSQSILDQSWQGCSEKQGLKISALHKITSPLVGHFTKFV